MPSFQSAIPGSSRHLDYQPSNKDELKDLLSALLNEDEDSKDTKYTFDGLEEFEDIKYTSADATLALIGADLGVADSLTLIDCKLLSMKLSDEDSDEEIGAEESKEESSDEECTERHPKRHRRSGVRRGQVEYSVDTLTFTIRTKTE